MPQHTDQQIRGATSLIRDGLRLTEGTSLLLLYQLEFADAALCISDVARRRGIFVEERSFCRDDFLDSYPPEFSPNQLLQSNPIPVGIVLLMEWSEETTGPRLSLLKNLQGAGRKWRIASMPGVRLADLPSCQSDLSEIEDRSRMVFAVLARSSVAIIETKGPNGDVDRLRIPISWHVPIISSGRINDGSWGNFPSGETFVVPNEYTASGDITIRGSFPRYVMHPGEWVRFSLRRGRIIYNSLEASSSSLQGVFSGLFFRTAGSVKSRNANALAELGIGTNPDIQCLTGNPVFDEKKIGTVHIAFGRNDQFSGALTGAPHHDVTCSGASVRVSDVTILDEGNFCLDWADSLPPLSVSSDVDARSRGRYRPTGSPSTQFKRALGDDPAFLSVAYTPSRGDEVHFTLASGRDAEDANAVLNLLTHKGPSSITQIARHLALDAKRVEAIVRGLCLYGLIEVIHST